MITRHPGNPILQASDVPFTATTVFNAGVIKWQGKYMMLFRNDYSASGGFPFEGCNLGLAESDDGISWRVRKKPVWDLERARSACSRFYHDRFGAKEILRFYDPRLTIIDDRCYLCFALDTTHGVRGGIAVTEDLETYEILSLSAPDNRNMVLFPEKIGGRFIRLERPFPVYGKLMVSSDNNLNAGNPYIGESFDIWMSDSENLLDWGHSNLVLGAEEVPYANAKIGPAAPPVRTERGWLTSFHAVHIDKSKSLKGWEPTSWHKVYYAGMMLLDLRRPSHVIGMMRQPLIAPEAEYELDGFRGSVIFPCGLILEDSGEVKIYYGAADTHVALATARLDDILDACEPLG